MDLGFNLAQSNRDLKDPTSRQNFGDTSGLLCKNDLIPCHTTTHFCLVWCGNYYYCQSSAYIHKTRNQIILTKQSGRVPKNLTASRILQISIALCQIKAKIHSFPTMYIIGGGKFGLTRWKKCLKPKRSPKNSCFGGNESQLHNFGRVWVPNLLRWPQFGGSPRKATCLSFKMSYVQGP